jgi:hypothetical protein
LVQFQQQQKSSKILVAAKCELETKEANMKELQAYITTLQGTKAELEGQAEEAAEALRGSEAGEKSTINP